MHVKLGGNVKNQLLVIKFLYIIFYYYAYFERILTLV